MTKNQFLTNAEAIRIKAQVPDGKHSYFTLWASRLYRSCEIFNLFSRRLGEVLEIGPYFGYTPFALRKQASSYTVIEGDDPYSYSLVPIYKAADIAVSYVDLFEIFGPIHTAMHALPASDSSYDTILCWETMEHFCFNPVKFVRELHRVLKPSGEVCITVPNRASFQAIYSLVFGRGQEIALDAYFSHENYESNGKKAYYGFHWREYTPLELTALFKKAGFEVQVCRSFTVFQDHVNLSFGRKMARLLSMCFSALLNRFGTNVYLIATKRKSPNENRQIQTIP